MRKIFICICVLVLLAGCGRDNDENQLTLPQIPQIQEDKKTDDLHIPENILVFSPVILEFIKDYDINVKVFDNTKLKNISDLSNIELNLIKSFKIENIFVQKNIAVEISKLKDIAPIVYIDLEEKNSIDSIKNEFIKLGKIFGVSKLVEFDILEIDTAIRLIKENSSSIEFDDFLTFIQKDEGDKYINSLHRYKKRIDKYIQLHIRRENE